MAVCWSVWNYGVCFVKLESVGTGEYQGDVDFHGFLSSYYTYSMRAGTRSGFLSIVSSVPRV